MVLTSQCNFGQGIGNNLMFDQLSVRHGLPDNFINFIFQDHRGFLWLATNHGLSRYDGRNFKNYTTLGRKGITDRVVNSIAEDKVGNIWFGTESGLNKLAPLTDTIVQYFKGSGPGTIPYHWCNYLYTDKEANLWLGTEKGLALYHANVDSFQNFPISVFGKDDRLNKFVNRITEDSGGKLWLSSSYGIKRFDKKTLTYISYTKEEINGQAVKENVFYSLFIDHSGIIWAGTLSNGLFKFNTTTKTFETIHVDRINSTIYDISEIKIGESWYLLLATGSGLISFKQGDKQTGDTFYSLADHSLTKIFTDRQHNLWVTGADGLFKLNSNNFAFKWLPLVTAGNEQQLVVHIIPDIKDPRTIFYLTTGRGWYTFNAVTQSISQHILPADKNQLLQNINSWQADDSGYWITSANGFGYYDIYKNKLLDLRELAFSASGQNTTGYIIKATANNYWVTIKRSGILVFDPSTKKDTVIFGDKNKPDNTYGNNITDMQKGPDGNIWFTSVNKLYRIDPANYSYKTFEAPSTDEKVAESKLSPFRILFTKSGRLLVCGRLRIYEFKSEQLITVYPAKGFSSFSIEKITKDPENNLWIKAEEGVFKTDSSFSRWEAMNKLPGWEDGADIPEINTTRLGEILFAGNTRIGVLKEDLLQKTVAPLPVIISRVRYGQKENYLVSSQQGAIKNSYKDAVEIELSPVDFIAEKENKILYQLRGWDDEWKELGGNSVIRYEQLPAGDYTFVTKSVNTAGMESAETKLLFTVVPPFYRTWWFISTLIMLLVTATFLFYRFRLKKALELERMRTRIATDLHDDIGATLSSISIYSQAVKSQLTEKNPNLENVLDKMGLNSPTW